MPVIKMTVEFRAGLIAGSISGAVILLAVIFSLGALYGATKRSPSPADQLGDLYLGMRPGIVRLDSLDAIAARRVAYMQHTGRYSHDGMLTPSECNAWRYMDGYDAWVGLLNSPPHRKALFNEKYTQFGVAHGLLEADGKRGTVWVVVLAGNSG